MNPAPEVSEELSPNEKKALGMIGAALLLTVAVGVFFLTR